MREASVLVFAPSSTSGQPGPRCEEEPAASSTPGWNLRKSSTPSTWPKRKAGGAQAVLRGTRVRGRADLTILSARQRDVPELVVEGFSNAEAARRLFISESAMKKHLKTAYGALKVKNRLQAAKKLFENAR